MKSKKAIEQLYSIIKKKCGRIEAKTTVRAILSNILDDLEEEGLEVSEKNISDRLQIKVNDYLEASKSEVA